MEIITQQLAFSRRFSLGPFSFSKNWGPRGKLFLNATWSEWLGALSLHCSPLNIGTRSFWWSLCALRPEVAVTLCLHSLRLYNFLHVFFDSQPRFFPTILLPWEWCYILMWLEEQIVRADFPASSSQHIKSLILCSWTTAVLHWVLQMFAELASGWCWIISLHHHNCCFLHGIIPAAVSFDCSTAPLLAWLSFIQRQLYKGRKMRKGLRALQQAEHSVLTLALV